jgi:hypothetical protein
VNDTEGYATAVVRVLRDHFPDLADPIVATVVTDAVERHARNPEGPFEVIVDDPITAKWRLHADNRDRCRVLLYIHCQRPSEADAELSRTVNDALRALEADQ